MALLCVHCRTGRLIAMSFRLPETDKRPPSGAERAPMPNPIARCLTCDRELYPGDVVWSKLDRLGP